MEYKVNLTELEDLAMSLVATDTQEWIDNAAKSRSLTAIKEITKQLTEIYFEKELEIPKDRLAFFKDAISRKLLKTAAELHEEFKNNM